jgi:hypothetical protein
MPVIVAQGDDEMRTGKLLVLFGLAAMMLGSQVVRTHTQTPARAAAAAPAAASPNDELIKLAMAGMGEDILLATVAKTDKSKYDTSADALLKLKAAGISQKVIAAILGITPTPASPAAPASLPEPIAPPGAAGLAPKARPISGAEDPLPATTAADETNLHFTIFISAPQRDGFFDTNKDIQDSIKDIKQSLSKEKDVILTMIDDRSKADVILTVVERGIGNQAYGRRVEFQAYYGGSNLQQVPMVASTYWVSTMMKVGAYKKEFTGNFTQDQQGSKLTFGAWGKCASLISSNVASWTKANSVLMNRYKLAGG